MSCDARARSPVSADAVRCSSQSRGSRACFRGRPDRTSNRVRTCDPDRRRPGPVRRRACDRETSAADAAPDVGIEEMPRVDPRAAAELGIAAGDRVVRHQGRQVECPPSQSRKGKSCQPGTCTEIRMRPVRLSRTPPKPAPMARTLPPNSASRATNGGICRTSQSCTSVAPLGSGTFSEITHNNSPPASASASCCFVAPISTPRYKSREAVMNAVLSSRASIPGARQRQPDAIRAGLNHAQEAVVIADATGRLDAHLRADRLADQLHVFIRGGRLGAETGRCFHEGRAGACTSREASAF